MDPALAVEVAAMSKSRALDEATAMGSSDVQQYYCKSTVFVTGGSGFMGKHIIEKLLRSCQLSKVFMLLRAKKGKSMQERLDVIVQDAVFDVLRKQQPDFVKKIVPIEGDTAELRLGIKEQDWETMVKEIDVIFHMAATTKFDETLKIATLINVRGTQEVIHLARACKNLRSFVYVSTAYSQSRMSYVDQKVYEKFYPVPIQAEMLLSMMKTMDVDAFNDLATSLIRDWANTYCFTKAVAEDLIRTTTDGLPVCIVRPGIVIGSYREPVPAWLDASCVYSASGLVLAGAVGIVHVVLMDNTTFFGIVPCDFVNNAIIVAGKEAVNSSGGENTQIYTVTTVARNGLTQGQLQDLFNKNKPKYGTPRAIYYSTIVGVTNRFLYSVLTALWHYVPAYIIDFGCLLLGKERRFVKLYRKVDKMTLTLSYFSLNNWIFVDTNLERLHNNLSKLDKTIFNFDIPSINWDEYILIWCIGIRKYLIKDGLKDTEKSAKKQYWLRYLNYCVLALYAYVVWKIFSLVFFSVRSVICCNF